MQTTRAWETLKQFRLAAYRTLGHRKDSLFELMEAVLAGSGPATIVRLSLAAVFRRGWSSAPDGEVNADACRRLVQQTEIEPAPSGRPVWALDGTVWPRPAAGTSPERTYGHRTTPGTPHDRVVPAWEYEWLVAVLEPGTGWVLPLDVERRGPTDGTPTAVAISMLRGLWCGDRPARHARWRPWTVATTRSRWHVLSCRSTCWSGSGAIGSSPARPGRTRVVVPPRKYGDVFRLSAPGTHGAPDARVTLADPQ